MKPVIFKAYDIRGKYPNEINEEVVGSVAEAVAKKIFKVGKVVIGRDARLSSSNLYRVAIRRLKIGNLKLKTIEAGTITTPMLYFLVNHFKAAGGIMITASHNPKNYNGLKIVGAGGEPISGEDIYKIWTT